MESNFNWPKEDAQQQTETISSILPFHTMKDRKKYSELVSLNDGVEVSTLHDLIVMSSSEQEMSKELERIRCEYWPRIFHEVLGVHMSNLGPKFCLAPNYMFLFPPVGQDNVSGVKI
jgi:hypothetical protein